MSTTTHPATRELADTIGAWLSKQIEDGATPMEVFDRFAPAMGTGVKMFAQASAEPPMENEVVNNVTKAILLYAKVAVVRVEAVDVH